MNFYLLSESFQNNSCTIEVINEKILVLEKINDEIKKYSNKLYKDNNTIYYIEIFNGLNICDFITNPNIDKYYKTKLSLLFDRHISSYNNEEIVSDVGFHKIRTDLICTIDELKEFYFNYLETLHNEDEFFRELKHYFSDLEFHENINGTLRTLVGGLPAFSESIIKSLDHLRNTIKDQIQESNNLDEALKRFTTTSGFETTLEGTSDPKIKKILSFEFDIDNERKKLICCEPHIKLDKSSINGDNTFYFNRIHFHQGDNEIKNGNILIGYIGKHLVPKKKNKK